MTRSLRDTVFASLLLAGIALHAGGSAHAQATDIGFCRAEQIALEKVKGTVKEMERGNKQGRAVISVEVRTPEGKQFDVLIDASDGSVIRVKQDD